MLAPGGWMDGRMDGWMDAPLKGVAYLPLVVTLNLKKMMSPSNTV